MTKHKYCDCGVPMLHHGTACGWTNAGTTVTPSNDEEKEWLKKWSEAHPGYLVVNEKGEWVSCPFCNAHMVEYTTIKRTLKIKGEDITADYSMFKCNNCQVEYTTDPIDEINIQTFKLNSAIAVHYPKTTTLAPQNIKVISEERSKGMEEAMISPDILRHADPSIMQQAGWVREEEWNNLRNKLETRIAELDAADVEFCKDRWDRPDLHPMQKQMAREESNKVTFARQELQSILKLLPKPSN